jgi:hypothetical protein
MTSLPIPAGRHLLYRRRQAGSWECLADWRGARGWRKLIELEGNLETG